MATSGWCSQDKHLRCAATRGGGCSCPCHTRGLIPMPDPLPKPMIPKVRVWAQRGSGTGWPTYHSECETCGYTVSVHPNGLSFDWAALTMHRCPPVEVIDLTR